MESSNRNFPFQPKNVQFFKKFRFSRQKIPMTLFSHQFKLFVFSEKLPFTAIFRANSSLFLENKSLPTYFLCKKGYNNISLPVHNPPTTPLATPTTLQPTIRIDAYMYRPTCRPTCMLIGAYMYMYLCWSSPLLVNLRCIWSPFQALISPVLAFVRCYCVLLCS